MFSNSQFFVSDSGRLSSFFYAPTAGRAFSVARVFAVYSVVMPSFDIVERSPIQRVMTVQRSMVVSMGAAGVLAAAGWLVLLAVGLWNCAVRWHRDWWTQLIVATSAAQVMMHVVFGGETFLYSIHLLPLLIVVTAATAVTPLRRLAVALAAVVTVAAAVNNQEQFVHAADFIRLVGDFVTTAHP